MLFRSHFFWDNSETLGTSLVMYLTRSNFYITRKNTLWKYLEVTLSSYPLPPPGPQFLPNSKMGWVEYYLVLVETTSIPMKVWELYP